jgi:2-iminoacetate synthase
MRRETFALGVSQISAGSRTNPGGYRDGEAGAQFSLGDHRPLDEVVADLVGLGYIPSFCTGCYRLGRTGADFMDLARPGEIRAHCDPNALSTFLEYLLDYAGPQTRADGEMLIPALLEGMEEGPRATSRRLLEQVRAGRRDVYC